MSEGTNGGPDLKHGDWQTSFPFEDGDWLWIRQWSCGCCLINSGIAVAEEWKGTDDEWNELPNIHPSLYRYLTQDNRKFTIAWGGSVKGDPPEFFDGKPLVDWWQRIKMPPAR